MPDAVGELAHAALACHAQERREAAAVDHLVREAVARERFARHRRRFIAQARRRRIEHDIERLQRSEALVAPNLEVAEAREFVAQLLCLGEGRDSR
jgi:hypothetical protein